MNHKTVVFNEAKMNFDGNLDFSVLSSEVVTYSDTTPDQFLERVADAEILVTKEMPVSREQILALPDSVKLICEAGTGYNNLDLDAAREKGITVCNIPAYSSERVAHTAISMRPWPDRLNRMTFSSPVSLHLFASRTVAAMAWQDSGAGMINGVISV